MAPKRSAAPPPVESSEGTASGSGTDESEEEIAHSPPSATPKNTAPPQQKVQQPEASDDEEETDDEAPQQESAPKQEAEGEGGKPPPSSEDKKQAVPFQRSWSKDDEVRILEALAAHRREHGTLPQPEDLEAALAGNLDNSDYGRKELTAKLRSLKALYGRTVKRGDPPSTDTDRRIFTLSKEVWGGGDRPANGTVPSDFGEMCKMYPYLAEEMKALERTQPGLFKREFSMIDNEKARALDQKIKKQRVLQMKLELRHHDVTKQVTKTLMDLVE